MHNLESPKRRVNQYVNIDGLLELATGVCFLLLSLAFVLADRAYTATGPGFYPLIWWPLFLGLPLIFHAVMWLKKRVTYPRTGLVEPRQPKYLRRRYLFLIFIVPVLLLQLPLFLGRESLGIILINAYTHPLLWGVLLAALFVVVGQGLKRFYGYAVVTLATGIGVSVTGLEPRLGLLILCSVTGSVTFVAGALVLRDYLKRNPETDL